MKSKYELQATLAAGVNHAEEQMAFSPAEHLALLGNFYQNFGEIKGRTSEGGIGYFKHYKNDLVWEIYGLYTDSRNNAHVTEYTPAFFGADTMFVHDFIANYHGYSLQFNIGQKYTDVELGISFRYSLFDYTNFSYRLQTTGLHVSHILITDTTYRLLNNRQKFFVLAPTLKFGSSYVKCIFQISFHFDLTQNGKTEKNPPYYYPILITTAVVFDFPFHRKNKETE